MQRTVTLARFGPPGSHELAVAFPYDEYVRNMVRDVPGRKWLEKQRIWTVPDNPSSIIQLKERLERTGWRLDMTPDVRAYLNSAFHAEREAAVIRDNGDAEVEWPLLTTPYAHQRAGLAFLSRLGGGALLWEMGLGKTAAAIAFCEALATRERAPGVLIICPNTIRRNWGQEIEKHAGHRGYVIPDGDYRKRIPLVGSRRYTILNTEALSHAAMVKALTVIEWDVVIVDESTRFKGPKAQRTKNLLRLPAKHRIILTGSPITNSPEDAWAPFEFVSPGLFGKSFWAFRDRYLIVDHFGAVKGIKPDRHGELRERIASRSYRILKADVLDLPEKVYVDRRVTLEGDQLRAYRQMRDELRVAWERGEIEAYNILEQTLRLTQITAGMVGEREHYAWIENSAKLRELDALLDELDDEPVVIFGIYQHELQRLAEHVYRRDRRPWVRYGARQEFQPIIYGPTPEKVRANLIDDFQARNLSTLLIQTRTGGLGINLTAARTAIYYTRGWSLEDYIQSQDRLHRIGQTGTVTIVHLIAEGTVDEQIARALRDKRDLADDLTGDKARSIARQVLWNEGDTE